MTTTALPTPLSADRRVPATRRLTGFKPTGRLQLGNLLGAVAPMVDSQRATDSVVMIADLHALTVEHDPARLRQRTTEMLATLLACGVDPADSICYVQSDVPEHAQLHYLLECATGYGEAARMIQFKELSRGDRHVRLSLLTYPVLMAADILLHDADEVPVGDDQTQHLELARDVANRFNTRYGRTFVVPRAANPTIAARVMDLADPHAKMGKTSTSESGVIFVLDDADAVRRKVARAMTDAEGAVHYDPDHKPGVSNLLEIIAACEADEPDTVALRFRDYAELKDGVVAAVDRVLAPVRSRYAELITDPTGLTDVRRDGAERACDRAGQTLARAKRAIGLSD